MGDLKRHTCKHQSRLITLLWYITLITLKLDFYPKNILYILLFYICQVGMSSPQTSTDCFRKKIATNKRRINSLFDFLVVERPVAIVVTSLSVGQERAHLLWLKVLVQNSLIGRVNSQRPEQMF